MNLSHSIRAVVVAFALIVCSAQAGLSVEKFFPEIEWREVADSLYMAKINDPVYVRSGSRTSVVVKFDSTRYRFEAFHYSSESDRKLLTVEEWMNKTGALVVFNAGQYFEDYEHMGLLVKNGMNLGTKLISKWKGLLVQRLYDHGPSRAKLLDLKFDEADTSGKSYQFAVQSLMLFDRTGARRVRKSDLVANRTILGVDIDGNILLFITEGGYTLWEVGILLKKIGLNVTHAMSLDGGFQSQLAVKTPKLQYVQYGKWAPQAFVAGLAVPGIRLKIPAVIAVFPFRP